MTGDDERLQRAQAESMPREDLSPYAGRWVALRDGYVMACGVDPESLRDLWGLDGVVLMPVPFPGVLI